MKKISPTVGIILVFAAFCAIAGLAFLFGLELPKYPFLAYPLEFLGFSFIAGVYLSVGLKRLRKAKEQGETIQWYKQLPLMAALGYGTLLLFLLANWLIPDRDTVIKYSVAIVLAVCFLGLLNILRHSLLPKSKGLN